MSCEPMECKSSDSSSDAVAGPATRPVTDSSFAKLLKELECPICIDTVSIPVRIRDRIFNCRCNNTYVMCLVCAREYFGMNKPEHKRERKKCIMCPERCVHMPRNARGLYDLDAVSARLMHSFEIKMECRRGCGASFTTANEARRHLSDECPEALTSCEACGKKRILRKDLGAHRDRDCPLTEIPCPACGDLVRRDYLATHCSSGCSKIMRPCWKCGKVLDGPTMAVHQFNTACDWR